MLGVFLDEKCVYKAQKNYIKEKNMRSVCDYFESIEKRSMADFLSSNIMVLKYISVVDNYFNYLHTNFIDQKRSTMLLTR